jgi:putative membrane protein
MTWIRTALWLIGLGFGIPALVKTIELTRAYDFNPVRFPLIVELYFINTEMLAIILGLRVYYLQIKQIQSDRNTYERTYSGVIVGVILVIIGLVSFVGVIIKSLIF